MAKRSHDTAAPHLTGPLLSPLQQRREGRDDLQTALANALPMGRIGTTQVQANVRLFRLFEQTGFITGTQRVVDGGQSVGRRRASRAPNE